MAMKQLHQNGDWALILRDNNTYLVRHLTCGSYLRHTAEFGCHCNAINKPIGQRKAVPVDQDIYKMFIFLNGAK